MQESFQRVLVTTDFSDIADHAVGHAFRLAADHGAEVVLCHVVDMPPAPNPLYAHYYDIDSLRPGNRRQIEARALEALRERVPASGPLAAVPHREIVVDGEPVHEIVALAAREKVDLMVIATHGRTGIKHMVLGSVAERVIRQVHCPVLVVR